MVFHANHPKVIDAVAILISDEIDFNKSVFFFFFFKQNAKNGFLC